MDITGIVTGSLSVPVASGSQNLLITVPGSIASGNFLSATLSQALPDDPANLSLFKFQGFNLYPPGNPPPWFGYSTEYQTIYYDAYYVFLTCVSTASASIDIDFNLVFTDTEEPSPVGYQVL